MRAVALHDHAEVETVIGDVCDLDDVLRAARGCDGDLPPRGGRRRRAGPRRARAARRSSTPRGTLNVLEAARQLRRPARGLRLDDLGLLRRRGRRGRRGHAAAPPAPPLHGGKLAGELYCRSYAELYGVESTILRFGIPYGPRARPAAVIPSFVAQARAGEPLSIAGSGEQQRAFVYVEDLAEGVVRGAGARRGGADLQPRRARGRHDPAASPRSCATRSRRSRSSTPRAARATSRARRSAATAPSASSAGAPRRRSPKVSAATPTWLAAQPPTDAADGRSRRRALGARAAGARTLAGRLGAAALQPARLGFAALIALVSSLLPALAATRGIADAAGVTLLAMTLIVPLWSVTVTEWPIHLRRVQGAIAIMIGLLGVGLAATFTPEQLGEVGEAHRTAALVLMLSAGSRCAIVPARLAER